MFPPFSLKPADFASTVFASQPSAHQAVQEFGEKVIRPTPLRELNSETFGYRLDWNHTKATHPKTTVSIAAAPRNAKRVKRVGANKAQRQTAIANNGARITRIGDSVAQAPRNEWAAARCVTRKSTSTTTPVAASARAPTAKTRQNNGYGRRKNRPAQVAGTAAKVKVLRNKTASPKAYIPLEASLTGPAVSAA